MGEELGYYMVDLCAERDPKFWKKKAEKPSELGLLVGCILKKASLISEVVTREIRETPTSSDRRRLMRSNISDWVVL
ncbi:hypothetical protein Syun_012124 [Stephania yunnanensis]|uniref:Uncharacterized protein n=1 Tax=Stephania yunnanensis TaxID=152371 RepID=A0AAP0JZP2_9MAGN